MNRLFTALTLFVLLSTTTFATKHLKDADANQVVEGTSELWYKTGFSVPHYIKFNENNFKGETEVLSWLKEEFQLPDGLEFIPLRTHQSPNGNISKVFTWKLDQAEVEFLRVILHMDGNLVYSLSADLYDQFEITNQIMISEEMALNKALQSIKAQEYLWDNAELEAWFKELKGDQNATLFPVADLVIISKNGDYINPDFKLAYKFNINANKPMVSEDVYIDAADGEVLFSHNKVHDADSIGLASTGFSGNQQITTSYVNNSHYILAESSRGQGIHTWNMENGTDFSKAVDFTDDDNIWPLPLANQLDVYATDAHWGVEMTYDYMMYAFNRSSIDGNGLELNAYVHYDENYNNARWNSSLDIMIFGDGAGNSNPLTTVDITGHEIAHGLDSYTADLIYQNESGALDESFADILGNCVEHYAKPGVASWLIGEDRGVPIRNMEDPKVFNQPDTYEGDNWYIGSFDNGGVHINSGVQNYWFYLLVEGKTDGTNDHDENYSVTSIGWSDAATIAYENLASRLTPTSTFEEAAFYSEQVAIELYGNCSPQHDAVASAWHAVGLRDPFIGEAVAEFSADRLDICAPATVQFTNKSAHGMTYSWTFGDGTGSTETNPNHTYSEPGQYTVTLNVRGGGCGDDELVQENFINAIDLDEPLGDDVEILRGDKATLNVASNSGTIFWYDSPDATEPIHEGNSFETPELFENTTYYTKTVLAKDQYSAGAAMSDALSNGQFTNINMGLIFDALVDLELMSITLNSPSAGNRKFIIKDANDAIIYEKSFDLVEGSQEINLDAIVPAGVGYVLSSEGDPGSLWILNKGTFPYEIPSLININGNTLGGNDLYPYYFDWQVKEKECSSDFSEISVSVLSPEEVNPYSFIQYDNGGIMEYQVIFSLQQDATIEYQVYSISGQVMRMAREDYVSQPNIQVNLKELLQLDALQSGVFFITITGGNLEKTEKIVIKGSN